MPSIFSLTLNTPSFIAVITDSYSLNYSSYQNPLSRGTEKRVLLNQQAVILLNMDFEVLDISGDIGLRAYGSTIQEAFINAGMGMYSFITDIDKVKPENEIVIDLSAGSMESMLVNYLNELIFQFDAYGFIGCRIEILEISDTHIKAKVSGEDFDPSKHRQGLLIKAATYHNLNIQKTGEVLSIDIIFDI